MKLLFCPFCHDVLTLGVCINTYCGCGKCEAHYLEDGIHALASKHAQIICLHNGDVFQGSEGVMGSEKRDDRVEMIRAWFAPKRSKNIVWRKGNAK